MRKVTVGKKLLYCKDMIDYRNLLSLAQEIGLLRLLPKLG